MVLLLDNLGIEISLLEDLLVLVPRTKVVVVTADLFYGSRVFP